jgi:hypothetical protein
MVVVALGDPGVPVICCALAVTIGNTSSAQPRSPPGRAARTACFMSLNIARLHINATRPAQGIAEPLAQSGVLQAAGNAYEPIASANWCGSEQTLKPNAGKLVTRSAGRSGEQDDRFWHTAVDFRGAQIPSGYVGTTDATAPNVYCAWLSPRTPRRLRRRAARRGGAAAALRAGFTLPSLSASSSKPNSRIQAQPARALRTRVQVARRRCDVRMSEGALHFR